MGPINCTERVLQKISITEPSLRFTGESFKAHPKKALIFYHSSVIPICLSICICLLLLASHALIADDDIDLNAKLMMPFVYIYMYIQLMMRSHCVTPLRVSDLPTVSSKAVTWAQSVNASTYAMGHRIMLEEAIVERVMDGWVDSVLSPLMQWTHQYHDHYHHNQ